MARDRFSPEDPRAPYTVYRGEKEEGTYSTRAEARRRKQQLESEQSGGVGGSVECRIEDIDGNLAL